MFAVCVPHTKTGLNQADDSDNTVNTDTQDMQPWPRSHGFTSANPIALGGPWQAFENPLTGQTVIKPPREDSIPAFEDAEKALVTLVIVSEKRRQG